MITDIIESFYQNRNSQHHCYRWVETLNAKTSWNQVLMYPFLERHLLSVNMTQITTSTHNICLIHWLMVDERPVANMSYIFKTTTETRVPAANHQPAASHWHVQHHNKTRRNEKTDERLCHNKFIESLPWMSHLSFCSVYNASTLFKNLKDVFNV